MATLLCTTRQAPKLEWSRTTHATAPKAQLVEGQYSIFNAPLHCAYETKVPCAFKPRWLLSPARCWRWDASMKSRILDIYLFNMIRCNNRLELHRAKLSNVLCSNQPNKTLQRTIRRNARRSLEEQSYMTSVKDVRPCNVNADWVQHSNTDVCGVILH